MGKHHTKEAAEQRLGAPELAPALWCVDTPTPAGSLDGATDKSEEQCPDGTLGRRGAAVARPPCGARRWWRGEEGVEEGSGRKDGKWHGPPGFQKGAL